MPYPEHEKLMALKAKRAAAQEFYDFLIYEKKLFLGARHEHCAGCHDETEEGLACGLSVDYLNSIHIQPEDLIAQFLGIDRNKLEAEKRQMLDELSKA